jgi:hypothetical protein
VFGFRLPYHQSKATQARVCTWPFSLCSTAPTSKISSATTTDYYCFVHNHRQQHHPSSIMLFLYMLRSAPIETHDLDTNQRYGFTLFLHMAKLVISMFFNMIVVGILIDSLGPDGSFVSSFLSHDDVLIDQLGKILVNMLAVSATGICLLVCCLVPKEALS